MLNKICYFLIFLTVNTIAQKRGTLEMNAGYGEAKKAQSIDKIKSLQC